MVRKAQKPTLIIILCFVFVLALTACGGGGNTQTTPPPATSGGGSGSGGGGGSTPAPATTAEPEKVHYVWNLGTIASDVSIMPDMNSGAERLYVLKDLLDEYTDGQIELVIHWSSVLGPQPQVFEQCAMGELEVFQGQPMSSNDPRFACWNIPFQFSSLEEVDAALDDGNGELFQMAIPWFRDHNMELLSMGGGFIRGYANKVREVVEPADVRGIKSRVYEDALVRTFWDGLTQTQMMGLPDVYSSLQTGAIDGVEMMATQVIINKYVEVVNYYTDINWQWVNSQMFAVSHQSWNVLSPEPQDAVRRAAREAVRVQTEKQIIYTDQAMVELERDYGVQVTRLTDDQRQVWKDYAVSQTDKYKEIIGAEMYDEYMAVIDRAQGN